MNYYAFAYPAKGFLIDGRLPASAFLNLLDNRRRELPPRRQFAMMNLLDSHDTDRLASMIVNGGRHPYVQPARFDYDVGERVSPRHFAEYDVSAPTIRHRRIQAMCVFLQMTYVGAPMIYYGSESGMWGGDDPDCRMPMIWKDSHHNQPLAHAADDPAKFKMATDLSHAYPYGIRLRRSLAAVRSGTFRIVAADDDRQLAAFERAHQGQRVLVVFNRSDAPVRWQFADTAFHRDAVQLDSCWASGTDEDAPWTDVSFRGGKLAVQLPPLTAVAIDFRARVVKGE
jgi:glycosidase